MTATPLHYAVIGTLSSSSYSTSLRLHRWISIACFAGAVLCFSSLCGLALTRTLAALALLLVGFTPLTSDLRVGNVNSLQLAGLAIYCWISIRAPRRFSGLLAGFWMGLLLAFKPNLLIIAGVMACRSMLAGDWRSFLRESMATLLGIVCAASASSWIWNNWTIWAEWYIATFRELSGWATVEQGNFSIMAFVQPKSSFVRPLLLVCLVGGAVAVGILARRNDSLLSRASRPRGASELWFLTVAAIATLLFTHLAWFHYFVLVVPGLLLVSTKWRPPRKLDREALRPGLIVLAWFCLTADPLLLLHLEPSTFQRGVVVIVGMLSLWAALWAQPPSALYKQFNLRMQR